MDYWAYGATLEGTARIYGLAGNGTGQIFAIGGISSNGNGTDNKLLILPLGPHYGSNVSATVLTLSNSDLGMVGDYDVGSARLALVSGSRNSNDDISCVVRNADSTWAAITWDGGSVDTPASVGFDPMGSIVVSGATRTPTGKDGVVVGRVSPSLNVEWMNVIGGKNSTEYAIVSAVTGESIYVGGYTYNLVEETNGNVGLLGKLALNGTLVSTHAMVEINVIRGVAGNEDGLYIVGGNFVGNRGVIAKIFPRNNTIAWSKAIGNGGNFGGLYRVREAASGSIYASGLFQDIVQFLVEFSPDGDLLNGWFVARGSSLSAWDVTGDAPVLGIERGGVRPGTTALSAIKLSEAGGLPFSTGYLRPFDSSVQVAPFALSLRALNLSIAPWNATSTVFNPPVTQLGSSQQNILCSLPTLPTPSVSPSAMALASVSETPSLSPSPTDNSRRLRRNLGFFESSRGSGSADLPSGSSTSGFDVTTLASATLPMLMLLLLALFCGRRHCSRRPGF
jgi:hypothetical protein